MTNEEVKNAVLTDLAKIEPCIWRIIHERNNPKKSKNSEPPDIKVIQKWIKLTLLSLLSILFITSPAILVYVNRGDWVLTLAIEFIVLTTICLYFPTKSKF